METVARPHERAGGRVVGRIDDERVPLEVTARIAMHLSDAIIDMRASVERDDAGPTHLHVEHHVIGTLEHLRVTVIPGPESRHAPADAALTQAAVLRSPCVPGA